MAHTLNVINFRSPTLGLIALFGMLWIFFAPFASASDTERSDVLPWVINAAPPFHFVSGEYQGQGICDLLIDVVDEQLPFVQKTRSVFAQTRITQQFEQRNQCFPCMIYRPERNTAVFTLPTHFYFPHGVITSAENARRMTERYGHPIELAALMQDPAWRFGFPAGRQYPALQHIIDAQSSIGGYRLIHTGENATLAILAMIKANRIDYTIDYQILHQVNVEQGDTSLVFLEIKETAGTLVLGAIGCTNNEWGQQMTEQINAHIDTIRRDPRFLESLLRWFENHPGEVPYRQLLEEKVWQFKPE
mgnify:CR=1 FL=1